MAFIAWPEIEAFHQIRKFIRVDPAEWWKQKELLHGTSTVHYKCKVKLHGTNAAVQVAADGTVTVQSRTNILSLESDNAGFARWVLATCMATPRVKVQPDHWKSARGHILFGEWIGPGIQKNVAVSEIPNKVFAIFAARPLDGSDRLIIEPDELKTLVADMPVDFNVHVLPWYEKEIDIDWKQSDEELSKATAQINDWVASVEACDPWVKATFNVNGTGEGLVFYPTSTPHLGFESFTNLVFKAKGEAHKMVATAKPAQINAEVANSINSFVEMVLTSARLNQGATAVGGLDMKLTGKFVAWVLKDVEKETQDELQASGLTFDQVKKAVSDKARSWYLEEAKK